MKTLGIVIGSLCVAGTAAAGVCPSECVDCSSGGNGAGSGGGAFILAVGALGMLGLFRWSAQAARRGGMALLLALLPAVVSNVSAAADKTAGAPAKTTIAEILKQPEHYAGKEVVVTARLADVCTDDGCLTLKDKFDVIEGVPPDGGFKTAPKVGATLNVTGTVKVKGEGERRVVVLAVSRFEQAKK